MALETLKIIERVLGYSAVDLKCPRKWERPHFHMHTYPYCPRILNRPYGWINFASEYCNF